jgi:Icc-related predicted phosphoesterase
MKRVSLCALLLLPLAAHAGAEDDDEEPPPSTWAEVGTRYQTECPAPFFSLEKPEKVKVGAEMFELRGSQMVRLGGPWKGPLKIGVLGAIKEASKGTRENIKRASEEFKKRGVNLVIANGDISEGEFDLEDAFMMLGDEISVPIFAHIGNSEGKGSFTRAFLKAQKVHPDMFNMNWIRHLDWGGIHVFSLPGYYNFKFLHGKAGCHYTPRDLSALRKLIQALPKDDQVILTAHGPPKSFGKAAIDVAFDAGNVGDPDMADLLETAPVPFGIFGHILESGGRVTSDLKTGVPQKLPMTSGASRLYMNAGSASSMPWSMLNGKPVYGMAAVMTVEDHKARVEFITLRKD